MPKSEQKIKIIESFYSNILGSHKATKGYDVAQCKMLNRNCVKRRKSAKTTVIFFFYFHFPTNTKSNV